MPTYQYVCETCGANYEVVQKFSDDTLTVHDPGCGGPVRKKFNAVGVVFKGTGFYRNDSRSSSTSSEAGSTKTETPAKAETAAKTETATKTDSTSSPAASPSPAPSAGSGSSSSSSSSSA